MLIDRSSSTSRSSTLRERSVGTAASRAEQLGLSLSAISLATLGAATEWRFGLAALGILAAIHGIMAFLRAGGDRVAPAGLFALTSGILIALGSEPAWNGELNGGWFVAAASAAFGVQIWSTPTQPSRLAQIAPEAETRAGSDALTSVSALVMFVIAGLLAITGTQETLAEFGALGAMTVLAVVGARSPAPLLRRMALPALATVVYATVIHSGDGRLRLVAAGFVVVVLAAFGPEGRWLKRLVVAMVPVGIVGMAWLRLRHIEELRPGGSSGRSGLESAIIPLRILRDVLVSQPNGLGRAWGGSYLSVPSSFAPSWFPTPSAGAIGYDLVAISAPDRVGSGYSLAGLSVAEWIYNFGWLTLPLFAAMLAWSFTRLDNGLAQAWQGDRSHRSTRTLLVLAAAVTLVAGLPDFAWAGSHTYLMRSLLKIVPVAVLALALVVVSGPIRSRRRPSASADAGAHDDR